MQSGTGKVTLVVEKDFGSRLQSLVGSGPVWLVDTESNRQVAVEYWRTNPSPTSDANVTTFKFLEGDSAAQICLGVLDVVDLHHGEYSGGYSVLEVIGVELSQELESAIRGLGFSQFESTPEGFRASR